MELVCHKDGTESIFLGFFVCDLIIPFQKISEYCCFLVQVRIRQEVQRKGVVVCVLIILNVNNC